MITDNVNLGPSIKGLGPLDSVDESVGRREPIERGIPLSVDNHQGKSKAEPDSFKETLQKLEDVPSKELRSMDGAQKNEMLSVKSKPKEALSKNFGIRQKVMQNFMDYIQSEFGIPPTRIVVAMTQMTDQDMLEPPEATASQFISQLTRELNLDPGSRNNIKEQYLKMLSDLENIEQRNDSKVFSTQTEFSDQLNNLVELNSMDKGKVNPEQYQFIGGGTEGLRGGPEGLSGGPGGLSGGLGGPRSPMRGSGAETNGLGRGPEGLISTKNPFSIGESSILPRSVQDDAFLKLSSDYPIDSQVAGKDFISDLTNRTRLNHYGSLNPLELNKDEFISNKFMESTSAPNAKSSLIRSEGPPFLNNNLVLEPANDWNNPFIANGLYQMKEEGAGAQLNSLEDTSLDSDQIPEINSLGNNRSSIFESYNDIKGEGMDFPNRSLGGLKSFKKDTYTPGKELDSQPLSSPRSFPADDQKFIVDNNNSNSDLFDKANSAHQANRAESTDEQNNIAQIMNSARYIIKKGGGETTLKLHPENLGQLHLKIVLNEGKISLQMSAETPEAKRLLEGSLHELKNSLIDHHLNVDRLRVDIQNNLLSSSDHGNSSSNSSSYMDQQREMAREQARQFLGQFREDNFTRRDQMYYMPDMGENPHRKHEAPLTAAAVSANSMRRYQGLNKGQGLNLVA